MNCASLVSRMKHSYLKKMLFLGVMCSFQHRVVGVGKTCQMSVRNTVTNCVTFIKNSLCVE